MSAGYVRVAVYAPIKEPLTYSSDLNIPRGTSVTIPLGARAALGIVLGEGDPPKDFDPKKIKSITEVHFERPKLSEAYLTWAEKLSQYYVFPLGLVLELAFPPLKKQGRKSTSKIPDDPPIFVPDEPKILTTDQKKCIQDIEALSGFQTHLLFGVTGSGKTEVYLQLLERNLREGKRGLVLVPEISLTPQLVSRFSSRFGDRIAVLHSHLTDRERTNQWWQMIEGKKDILIGARSALFCPVENLGLIVVDEEHEASYKQEEKLRYNARDASVMMGQVLNCPVILGSATPSLETWHNTKIGKYHLHRMGTRASKVEMPDVEIIDLRSKEGDESKSKSFWATPQLLEEIQLRLEKKEQSALFINRRGLAQSVICPACGARKECPNCSIGLTLHASTHLVCHYCDYQETLSEICNVCLDSELKPIGLGTELVEKDIKKLFPDACAIRADRDEIQSRAELELFISKVESREADILIGTQMIAKGLDFPYLTLVGVLLADISLNFPDFRSAERSFQLLSQVSGRAGRHLTKGKVFIQTFNPEHPSILAAQTHSFESFAEPELLNREELGYPPFGRLMLIRLQSLDKKKAERAADDLASKLAGWVSRSKASEGVDILGPSEAPIFRLRNKYRYQILIKAPKKLSLSQIGWSLVDQEASLPKGVRMIIDIDPINML